MTASRRLGWGPAALAAGLLALLGTHQEATAQTWSTFQATRQTQQERELRVDVEYGAGRFVITPAASEDLYRVRLRYDEESFEPIHRYDPGRLRIGMEGSARRLVRGENEGELELQLGRSVPTDLRMEFGAVRAEMDFGGVPLTRLELSTGASDASLRVSSPNPATLERAVLKVGAASLRARELGRLNAREIEVEAGVGDVRLGFEGLEQARTRIKVSMGLGSLEIRIPRGVGIRLVRSTFLTSVNAPGLTRSGDAYLSAEWQTADRRVEIEIDAAFGSVSIVRVEP